MSQLRKFVTRNQAGHAGADDHDLFRGGIDRDRRKGARLRETNTGSRDCAPLDELASVYSGHLDYLTKLRQLIPFFGARRLVAALY